ncbi:MAG: hypothetical protein QG635_2272, partial [Bacteroidota bacterium]|nr:hypothetical protein [Bacteroidota bacterium]
MEKMRIIYISAIAVVLLMAMQSCGDKPSDYGMPQWDTDLNLPLTMRTYHLKDLIEEDKYIKIDSLTPGGIYVIYSDTLNKRLGVEDFIKNQFTGDYFNNKFPIFQGEGTAYLSFKNGAEIDSAHFTTGQMKLDVVNPANEALNYTVTVPGLFLPSGTPYSHIGSISPKSFETINEDLTGFSYTARNQTDRSKIRFDIKSNTGYTGDSVLFNMNFSNTNFSYIEGVIPTAELNPINKSLSMPLNPDVLKFRDKIILGDASLKI